jgi:hypothetical protein
MPCGICRVEGHNRRSCTNQVQKEVEAFVGECVICYSSLVKESTGIVTTNCNHSYCVDCFSRHIRLKTDCAYCRRAISQPIQKKRLTRDQKSKIVEDTLLNGDVYRSVYKDFFKQAVNNIMNYQVDDKNARVMQELCINAIENISMDYCIWFTGIQVCEAISAEYE